MKAIIQTEYGTPDTLKLEEIPKPSPRDDEVLVEVFASSVNFGNLALMKGEPFLARFWSGLRRPKDKIPGGDVAGRVKAVGRGVKWFSPGDEVFGDLSACGFGAFAEYVCAPEASLGPKPDNMSFEEAAAAAQAAVVALQGLRKGKIRAGQQVLINGASGGIGTYAVQIAKAFGAEVTGVCGTWNLELVRSLGADHVIDYTKEDFADSEKRYDLILATAGYRPIFDYRSALKPKGTYVAIGGAMAQIFEAMLIGPWISMMGSRKLGNLLHSVAREDLIYLKDLIEADKVRSVIDRHYPLSEVADALCFYEEGHARGKIAIMVKQ